MGRKGASSLEAEFLARTTRELDDTEASFLFTEGLAEPPLVLHFLSLIWASTLPLPG
ncbi:hypothetical protein Tco_0582200, partial [Tanacetum coccineum]